MANNAVIRPNRWPFWTTISNLFPRGRRSDRNRRFTSQNPVRVNFRMPDDAGVGRSWPQQCVLLVAAGEQEDFRSFFTNVRPRHLGATDDIDLAAGDAIIAVLEPKARIHARNAVTKHPTNPTMPSSLASIASRTPDDPDTALRAGSRGPSRQNATAASRRSFRPTCTSI